MSTKQRNPAFALGLVAAAALSGCSTKRLPQPVHDVYTVPVCSYTVQKGDGIETLFNSQIGKGNKKFYKVPGVTDSKTVITGEEIRDYDGKRDRVQFTYDVYRLAYALNKNRPEDPSTNPSMGHDAFTLRRGETILIPDLNKSGSINNEPCVGAGELTFDNFYDSLAPLDHRKLVRVNGGKPIEME